MEKKIKIIEDDRKKCGVKRTTFYLCNLCTYDLMYLCEKGREEVKKLK